MDAKSSFITKWHWRTTAVFLSLFLLILIINTASAATPVHNVTQDTYHMTLQEGIDNAIAGDVIAVEAGTYNENITINIPVMLQGAGSDCSDDLANTIIKKVTNTPVVTLAASGTAVPPPVTAKFMHTTPRGFWN